MKSTEIRNAITAQMTDALLSNLPCELFKVGNSEYVAAFEVDGNRYYGKFTLTSCDFIGTKTRAPFNLDTALAKYEDECAEKERKALEKEEEKKRKAEEKARAKATAEAE